jgi:hypothetical protein
MKLTRLAALVAVPVALSLAACGGGGSTGIANVTGQQAYVRYIQGSPTTGSVDLYLQSAGSSIPSSPFATLSYAQATDFIAEPAVGGTLTVRTAGSAANTTAPALTACPLPQLANNGIYDVVIAVANNTPNCLLFQDQPFSGTPQIRLHDAASATSATPLEFGTGTSGSFTVIGNATLGNAAAGGASPVTYTSVSPVSLAPGAAGPVTFGVGTTHAGTGGTETAVASVSSTNFIMPGGAQNTSGALTPTGVAGDSLFALDCSASVQMPPGTSCTNGLTLVGYTDSK